MEFNKALSAKDPQRNGMDFKPPFFNAKRSTNDIESKYKTASSTKKPMSKGKESSKKTSED